MERTKTGWLLGAALSTFGVLAGCAADARAPGDDAAAPSATTEQSLVTAASPGDYYYTVSVTDLQMDGPPINFTSGGETKYSDLVTRDVWDGSHWKHLQRTFDADHGYLAVALADVARNALVGTPVAYDDGTDNTLATIAWDFYRTASVTSGFRAQTLAGIPVPNDPNRVLGISFTADSRTDPLYAQRFAARQKSAVAFAAQRAAYAAAGPASGLARGHIEAPSPDFASDPNDTTSPFALWVSAEPADGMGPADLLRPAGGTTGVGCDGYVFVHEYQYSGADLFNRTDNPSGGFDETVSDATTTYMCVELTPTNDSGNEVADTTFTITTTHSHATIHVQRTGREPPAVPTCKPGGPKSGTSLADWHGHWVSSEKEGGVGAPYIDVRIGAQGSGLTVSATEEDGEWLGVSRHGERCMWWNVQSSVGPVTPTVVRDNPAYAGVDLFSNECTSVGGKPSYWFVANPWLQPRGDTVILGNNAKLVYYRRVCSDGSTGGYLRYERRDANGAIITDAVLSTVDEIR
jgi:hypothetical protein